jgi:hypothetical protein
MFANVRSNIARMGERVQAPLRLHARSKGEVRPHCRDHAQKLAGMTEAFVNAAQSG